MKFKLFMLTTCISIFSSSSVLAISTTDNTNVQMPNSSVQQKEKLSNNQDGEIIATLIILNKNEIAAANLADKKKLDPAVKSYVKTLHKDHAKNLDSIIILSKEIKEKPQQTEAVSTLKQQGDQQIAALEPLNGQQFEIMFIDNMVKGHQAALNRIDNALIKNANNPQLKKHLEATREKVEKHLKQAQQIQSQLQSSAMNMNQNANTTSSNN